MTSSSVYGVLPPQAHHHYVAPQDAVFEEYLAPTPAEAEALLPKAADLPLDASGRDAGASWVREFSDGEKYHQIRQINLDPPIYGRSIGAWYRCEVPGKGRLILSMRVTISAQPDEIFADRSKRPPPGNMAAGGVPQKTGPPKNETVSFKMDFPAPGTATGIVSQRGQVVTEVWIHQWARKDHPAGVDIIQRCHDLLMANVERSPLAKRRFVAPNNETVFKLTPDLDSDLALAQATLRDKNWRASHTQAGATVDTQDTEPFWHLLWRNYESYYLKKDDKKASLNLSILGMYDPYSEYERQIKEVKKRGDPWTDKTPIQDSHGDGGVRFEHESRDRQDKVTSRSTILIFQKGMFIIVIDGDANDDFGPVSPIVDRLAKAVLANMNQYLTQEQLAARERRPKAPVSTVPEETELVLRIEAEGFYPREISRITTGDPSELLIGGEIADGTLAPIAGATVSCESLGMKVKTNAMGIFLLRAKLSGKGKVWRLQETLKLKRTVDTLSAKLTAKKGFFANGRMVKCTLEVTADGNKLGNRRIYVVPDPDYIVDRNDKPSFYVVPGPHARDKFQGTFVLDGMGITTFELPMPAWRDKRVVLPDQEVPTFFPVFGRILVRDLITDKTCYVTYTIESPFPVVERLSMVATYAGDWQSDPASHLILADPDAEVDVLDDPKYMVEMKAYGDLRVAGTGRTSRDHLVHNFTGKDLHFNYRPPVDWSDNIKNLPDLGKRLGKAALKQLFSVAVDKGLPGFGQKLSSIAKGGKVISKLGKGRDVYNAISLGINGMKAAEISVKAAEALGPQNVDTAVINEAILYPHEIMDPVRLGQITMDKVSSVIDSKVVKDWEQKFLHSDVVDRYDAFIDLNEQVISTLDVSNNLMEDLANKTGRLDPASEVVKMAYVLSKEWYNVHRENMQIANSYVETVDGRIQVWITDADGHITYATRRPIVLIHKRGK